MDRFSRMDGQKRDRFLRFGLAVFLLLMYAGITLHVSSRQMPPTGDEPHYLVIAQSLAVDHDISLLNDYRERNYRVFYPGLLPKRTSPSGDQTRELATFGPGLPLFLAPFYWFALKFFPTFLVAFLRLVICMVTLAGIHYLVCLLFSLAGQRKETMILLAVIALTSPIVTYSSMFYPEVFGFLFVSLSLWHLHQVNSSGWRMASGLWLALIPGLMIWFHIKYLTLAVLIVLISCYLIVRHFRNQGIAAVLRNLLIYGLTASIVLFSFFVFLRIEYGGWSPGLMYGGYEKRTTVVGLLFEKEGLQRLVISARMMIGFWIDQRLGLLPHAPYYVIFFPAFLYALRHEWKKVWFSLILFLANFGALCWAAPLGGHSPPSRHFVVMIPFLSVAIAAASGHWTRWQQNVFRALQVVALFISGLMLTHYRMIFSSVTWRTPDDFSLFFKWLRLEHAVPNLIATNPNYWLILWWILIIAAPCILLFPKGRNPAASLPSDS